MPRIRRKPPKAAAWPPGTKPSRLPRRERGTPHVPQTLPVSAPAPVAAPDLAPTPARPTKRKKGRAMAASKERNQAIKLRRAIREAPHDGSKLEKGRSQKRRKKSKAKAALPERGNRRPSSKPRRGINPRR
jgi:hypothetical protein